MMMIQTEGGIGEHPALTIVVIIRFDGRQRRVQFTRSITRRQVGVHIPSGALRTKRRERCSACNYATGTCIPSLTVLMGGAAVATGAGFVGLFPAPTPPLGAEGLQGRNNKGCI